MVIGPEPRESSVRGVCSVLEPCSYLLAGVLFFWLTVSGLVMLNISFLLAFWERVSSQWYGYRCQTQLFESFAPVLWYVCGVLGACMCVYVRVYVACGCMHVYAYVCVWSMHMRLEVDFNILSNPPQFFFFFWFVDFMCMQVYVCIRFPRVKSYMWLESGRGCWEFNLGSLPEQQAAFLIVEQ